MPAPRKRRAVRRPTVNRRVRRSSNLSTIFVLLLLVAFALIYTFGGHFFTSGNPYFPEEGEIFVHFIDVGQGDATLIRTAHHAVLIDGGEPRYGQQIVRFLRDAGVTRLDYVVATHPHSDHIGGLIAVLNQKEVGQVIMPDATHNTVAFENFLAAIDNHHHRVRIVSVGDRLTAGLIDLHVLAPIVRDVPWATHELNDASVVLRMVYGTTSFLFTGDAERASEAAMLAGGHMLASTVLHVGHHGSQTSTTQAFLDAVNPVVAVISYGVGNQHGHPHPTVLARLYEAGVRILRTGELGNILLVTDGANVTLY